MKSHSTNRLAFPGLARAGRLVLVVCCAFGIANYHILSPRAPLERDARSQPDGRSRIRPALIIDRQPNDFAQAVPTLTFDHQTGHKISNFPIKVQESEVGLARTVGISTKGLGVLAVNAETGRLAITTIEHEASRKIALKAMSNMGLVAVNHHAASLTRVEARTPLVVKSEATATLPAVSWRTHGEGIATKLSPDFLEPSWGRSPPGEDTVTERSITSAERSWRPTWLTTNPFSSQDVSTSWSNSGMVGQMFHPSGPQTRLLAVANDPSTSTASFVGGNFLAKVKEPEHKNARRETIWFAGIGLGLICLAAIITPILKRRHTDSR